MNPATWLGWASMAIGTTEFLAPRGIESLLGIEQKPRQERLTRILGARELLHGASLLSQRSTSGITKALWGRVAGDVLDTAMLAVAAAKTRRPTRFALATAAVLSIGAIDLYCAVRARRRRAYVAQPPPAVARSTPPEAASSQPRAAVPHG